LPGANFPAVKKSDRRPLIRVPSIAVPRSSTSFSTGDEVPHIFTRKSRLQLGEFLIVSAKRLLQQYLPIPDLSRCSKKTLYSITILKDHAVVTGVPASVVKT
jgi:hypothetical protein